MGDVSKNIDLWNIMSEMPHIKVRKEFDVGD